MIQVGGLLKAIRLSKDMACGCNKGNRVKSMNHQIIHYLIIFIFYNKNATFDNFFNILKKWFDISVNGYKKLGVY